jgi:predicted ATPase
MIKTNWIVITGAPSSGKTSVIQEIEIRGYAVRHELARQIIEAKLSRGITLDELINKHAIELQNEIVNAEILDQQKRPPLKVIFLDRGMGDRIAMDRSLGIDPARSIKAAKEFLCSAVFIMDPLPSYVEDGVRVQTAEESKALDLIIEDVYSRDLGYSVTRVPVMPVSQRADYILNRLSL